MPRFIHTADWQIGKQFGQFEKSEAAFLTDQRINTVAAIGELASRQQADAVLVAGDVFDMQAVSSRTLHRLATAMESFAGPWVLLPGNHDAALSESVWQQWQQTVALPANIYLALKPGVVELTHAGLAVLCAPLTQRHSQRDLTEPFAQWETGSGLVRVGLAHGSVQGILPDEMETQNPISPARADQARLDYLALGDWHGTLVVNERTAYSGTAETDIFRNNDSGNVLEVEIPKPGDTPQVTVHPMSHYRWQEVRFHLTVNEDLDRLRAQLEASDRRAVVKLRLEGAIDLEAHQRLRHWLDALAAQIHTLQVDDSELALLPSDADIAGLHADGYLAEVIAELGAEQAQDETSREALKILLQKLAMHQKEPPS